uniref:RNA-directed DNA polymerase from mobile element jockey-like n=1 Tax=Saccoglossus kowalevskii TaxID=10224 RepID=A0ABM0GXG3_SACKO|nr:PREDICTED: RNA-directed DNA polymerase from mobile element jockey-like [Saccoglossus kowalevskii]
MRMNNHSRRINYTKKDLFSIRNSNICTIEHKCSLSVWNRIRSLGIQSKTSTHRGKRAGTRKLNSHPQRTITRNQHFQLGCWNVHLIQNKATLISDYIVEHNIDALAITESWLKASGDEPIINEVTPAGYTYHHFPRVKSTGGGIAFIFKSSITVTTWKPLQNVTTFEAVEATLRYHGITFKVIIVYRPPPNTKNKFTVSKFFNEFGDLLESSSTYTGNLSIIGDFNFHWANVSPDPNTRKFQELLDSCNLKQWVNTPTHTHGHTFDLVFTNPDLILNVTVDTVYISDHFPIYIQVLLPKPPLVQKEIKYRRIADIVVEDFECAIKDALIPSQPSADVNLAVFHYNSCLRKLLNKHAPQRKQLITVRPNADWYTTDIMVAKKTRRFHERKWRTTKLEIHKQIYRTHCSKVHKLIQNAKSKYYSDIIEVNAHNQKALFQLSSNLTTDKTSPLPTHSSLHQLTESFSEFFTNKITNIRHGLDLDGQGDNNRVIYTSNATCTSEQLSSFQPTTTQELKKIIKESPSKSCCLDPIPTYLFKKVQSQIIPWVMCLINLSFQQGLVPANLKFAVVIPLLTKKTLDQQILNNYRPISNLPFLSKVLEKVVARRLNDYLAKNSLLEPLQSAYRKFHSTETALIKVHNDISMCIDAGQYVILVLLDLSAAFDTIDRDILLAGLADMGICDLAWQWLASYLTNRHQSIVINGHSSKETTLHYGVPHRSELCPLLFSIYISSLGQIIRHHNLHFHQYSDDNQLYLSFTKDNISAATSQIENCLSNIKA